MLTKEQKQKLVEKVGSSKNDTGSAGVQIAMLGKRIEQIALHLKTFPKDIHSRYGLLKLVGKKRRLTAYLKKVDKARHDVVIEAIK
jgi:small subunit ribosomal protein S15